MPRYRSHKHGHHSYYSLYNVVAGRHRHEGRDPTRTSHEHLAERPLAPDEYMLRRWSKLQMYPFEEHADLPDSELVMAIHWYVSKRAAALGPEAFEYMDASALLAIAVEIEEQMSAALGKYGHLVYAQRKRPENEAQTPEVSDTEAEEEADEAREEQQSAEAAQAAKVESPSEALSDHPEEAYSDENGPGVSSSDSASLGASSDESSSDD